MEQNTITPSEELVEIKYAGFWIRVLATIIDAFVLAIPSVLAALSIYLWNNVMLLIVTNVLLILYKPFTEHKIGGTVGKRVLDIKVVDSNFQQMSLLNSIGRNVPWIASGILSMISYFMLLDHPELAEVTGFIEMAELQNEVGPAFASTIVSLFLFVSVLTVAFNEKKRGLHDLIADTYCIKTK